MRTNPDRRMSYEPELTLSTVTERTPARSWLPVPADPAGVDVTRWQTRASRGLAWHRGGRFQPRRAH